MKVGAAQNRMTTGFTIVELLIVVVVIAILAAITIVAFNGIQDQAKTSALKSDLANAVKSMEAAKAADPSEQYPSLFPSNVKVSSSNTLSLSTDTTGFCVNAEILASKKRFYYSTSDRAQKEGTCPGNVVSGSELGIKPNIITDTIFSNNGSGPQQWGVSTGGATTHTTTVRNGTASDPYPNKPVLQNTNTPNSAVTWSFLRGPVNLAGITSGTAYKATYYVRVASGTFTGSIAHYGVMSGSATNSSIAQTSGGANPNSDWVEVTRNVTASQNGVAGTAIYLGLSVNDARNNAYVLEFQGFELRPI